MSFTSNVKNEISHLTASLECNIAELSAIIRNFGVEKDKVKIVTENAAVARRVFNLTKEVLNTTSRITVRKNYNFGKGYLYIIEFSISDNNYKKLMLEPNLDLLFNKIANREIRRAYLRGVFISSGSINDPKKSRYHLEFIVNDKDYAEFVKNLVNEYDLNTKIILRDNKYMIYIKEAEKISDFLRVINADGAVLYFEDIRIYRDHKNMTNRLNNCEQANVDKIVMSASEQVFDIELIKSINGLELLDEKIKEVAIYRLKYPEVSLSELAEIITLETGNKISKSGVNHRMKKIKEMAERIRKKEKDLI